VSHSAPLLTLDHLVAGYAQPITAPCSFSLHRGAVVGLHGPNGVGKSTLLNALAGGARIHAGRLERAPDLRLRHLPQRPTRPAEAPLSGHDLLRCMAAESVQPPPRLAAKLNTRIDRLSGGEYQLLCLWTCLGGDADLVLLDEPTNNLDREHTDLAAEEIGAERSRRATIVVSHDPEFLQQVCTRIIQMAPRGVEP
jgi:ATPase subunit of ABC transporter with duplicated ATPase domains